MTRSISLPFSARSWTIFRTALTSEVKDSFSAGAGEGDYEGWVVVLRGEDVDHVGVDGGTLPESGDEDQGWFRHLLVKISG